MFSFILLGLSDYPHHVTLIFKNTKNSFLSLLVSIRPLTSYDPYFQVIQKHQTNTTFSKHKNINIFKQKIGHFFKNYVILDSPL